MPCVPSVRQTVVHYNTIKLQASHATTSKVQINVIAFINMCIYRQYLYSTLFIN